MPSLLSRTQEIIGEKIFRHLAKFMGDVVFSRTITAYSPRPSELSWGTKHPVTPVTVSTTATASGINTIDLSAYVPNGTKAVTIRLQLTDAATTTAARVQDIATSSNYFTGRIVVANTIHDFNGDVPLDSSRQFQLNNTAAFDAVTVFLVGYYI